MAKNNNLTDFLIAVADAIRSKKGTSDLINPQDFESEILSIETGGGDQPVMNAPTISLSGRQLTMNNPSTNGNFFSKFKVFVNDTLKSEETENTLDLYTYFNEDGMYNLAAKCAGINFQDSEASNSVSYTKFTPAGGVDYYGNATELSVARSLLSATTVGNYALFAGGYTGMDGRIGVVDAYDVNLTRTIPTELSVIRKDLAATTIGDYALFGGGLSTNYTSVVDAYNINLTRTTTTELSVARCSLSATTVGNYALFAGGISANADGLKVVDAYDINLTRTIPTELSYRKAKLASANLGNYALFGGGEADGSATVTVEAYDENLTKTRLTNLSQTRFRLSSTTVGSYALFCGGMYLSGFTRIYLSVVDAYDVNLTRTIPTELSVARSLLSATTVGNYALFAGGTTGESSAVVDVYSVDLTRTTTTELSVARSELSATTIGDYALFAGGYISSENHSNAVEVYTIQS